MYLNSTSIFLFQGIPGFGAAGPGALDFLRNNPQVGVVLELVLT